MLKSTVSLRTATRILARERRTFAKLTSPGPDPLVVLKDSCLHRNLCDEHGYRVPGVHWVFSIAVGTGDALMPPNLRTIGMQHISQEGIDFCVKKGSLSSTSFSAGNAVSILYSQGKYLPGEKAEQWRAEGYCEKIPLEDILDHVPHYTIIGMVASKRIAKDDYEGGAEHDRVVMKDKSHFTEIIQQTRIELENGDIPPEEIESSVRAYRFMPDRMERMKGGPDSVLWERWEWVRSMPGVTHEGTLAWYAPEWLLPH